jgi:diguanylate cyclase (GGDEF)-like protein
MAYYDYLTGLPNRQVLLDTLKERTSFDNIENNNNFFLIFADIDNFSNINDSFGHDAGDAILQEISRRWNRHIKGNNMLGRWGGDEFVFIFKNITYDNHYVISFINKLQKELEKPFIYNSQKYYITSSFGLPLFQQIPKTVKIYLICRHSNV